MASQVVYPPDHGRVVVAEEKQEPVETKEKPYDASFHRNVCDRIWELRRATEYRGQTEDDKAAIALLEKQLERLGKPYLY